jgi:hypothetical protein
VVDLRQAGATAVRRTGVGGQTIVVLLKARAVGIILAATRLDSRISDEDLKPLTEGVLARALL